VKRNPQLRAKGGPSTERHRSIIADVMEYHSFPDGTINADDLKGPRPLSQWNNVGKL
jgi:hypothetical protein